MNKIIQGLLASTLACASFANGAALQSGSTFIAHRDELANLGMEWTTTNHLAPKAACKVEVKKDAKLEKNQPAQKCVNPFGATLTATGFYSESTNHTDLAKRFGIGATGAIKITKDTPTADNLHEGIYGLNIHHSPNSNGTSGSTLADADNDTTAYSRTAMNGTLNLAPKRTVYGAHLGWKQSLDGLLKGLSLSVRAPIVQVKTNMHPTVTGSEASAIPPVDGKSGATVADYFGGKLTTDIATYAHVSQAALKKNIINAANDTATGVADVEMGVNYAFDCCAVKGLKWGFGATAQVPTGKKPDGIKLFEAIYGARGHFAAGANGMVHFDAFSNKDIRVSVDVLANYKYFFKGTEVRTMGIYDISNKVMLPASQYRLLMHHGVTGVLPAANVLTVEHDVTPGHQVDALAGLSIEWKNFTFDIGYNLFWHAAEKVVQRTSWSNDAYALAHPHYSMKTTALGNDIVGGTSYIAAGDDDVINHNGYVNRSDAKNGDYIDASSSVEKHGYVIGSNGDAGGTPLIITYVTTDQTTDDDLDYPGAYTSINGPIQKAGVTTSALLTQSPATVDDEDADIVSTGVNVAGEDTLTVQYNVSSLPAVTNTQITHSVVGGVSYKIPGAYPMIIGVGGQGEFQESGRNSALEGFKVWAKFGISF
jgi:hypothetical protein